jgi:hypothetical protein
LLREAFSQTYWTTMMKRKGKREFEKHSEKTI